MTEKQGIEIEHGTDEYGCSNCDDEVYIMHRPELTAVPRSSPSTKGQVSAKHNASAQHKTRKTVPPGTAVSPHMESSAAPSSSSSCSTCTSRCTPSSHTPRTRSPRICPTRSSAVPATAVLRRTRSDSRAPSRLDVDLPRANDLPWAVVLALPADLCTKEGVQSESRKGGTRESGLPCTSVHLVHHHVFYGKETISD
jgi:hypothetical protein